MTCQTLCVWVEAAANWLSPHYREMQVGLVAGDYLQTDETPIRYSDPDVKGKSQQGYLWTYSHPCGDVVFEWKVSRSREGPQAFMKSTGRLASRTAASVIPHAVIVQLDEIVNPVW